MSSNQPDVGQAVVAEARDTLAHALHKIEHCLDQLGDADVTWRPRPEMNSVAIVINHLCGNLRQWIVSGVGGAPDVRDRPAEFRDPGAVGTRELIERITAAVGEVDATLAAFDPGKLTERRHIQEFDVVLLHAILDTACHIVGHTHQIVYITRMRLGDAYRFEWAPTKE